MESNHQQSWDDAPIECDGLDRALDAALAKYSAAEPRVGLEQRILTRLQCEQDTNCTHSWWQWTAVGTIASVLIIATALTRRSDNPPKIVVQQHRSAPVGTIAPSSTPEASSEAGNAPRTNARSVHMRLRHSHPAAVVADGPKLEQFPSPEPLTSEELALVRYVKQFPRDAAIIANAQEEFEKEVQQEVVAFGQAPPNSTEEER